MRRKRPAINEGVGNRDSYRYGATAPLHESNDTVAEVGVEVENPGWQIWGKDSPACRIGQACTLAFGAVRQSPLARSTRPWSP
jgi:hypothetical protein